MKSEQEVRKLMTDLQTVLRARLRGQQPSELKETKAVMILSASVSLLKFILDEQSDFDLVTEEYLETVVKELKRRTITRPIRGESKR